MHVVTTWVVYGLRLPDCGEYRYVGQTQFGAAHRLKTHRNSSKYRSTPVYRWMSKHEDVQIDVLEYVLSESLSDLDETEIYWIDRLKFEGHRLLNCDSGGRSAYTQTESSRNKRSRSGELHYNFGKTHSDATKAKLSEARRNRVTSDETRKKMSHTRTFGHNPNRKLTPDDIRSIRKKSSDGVTGRTIAIEFGITPANVSSILRGKTWTHVK